MRLTLPLLLLAGCAVLPVSPRRLGTLEERVATLEKRMDVAEQAAPAFSFAEEAHSAPVASVGMSVPYEAATKTVLGARNSSGTMSLVSGNPVVSGNTITSTWANNTLSDIATELTDSLSRSGKGAMLAGLKGYVGTVSLPGYTFNGDTNTGLYWINSDDFGAAVGGAKVQEWAATGVTFTPGITVTQSQTNTDAITATGNGSGSGIRSTGGTTGAGGTLIGGGTTGSGVVAQGAASGGGAVISAGATAGVGLVVSRGNGVNATVRMATGAQPTGPNVVGDMYMSAAGILNICTVAGSPGTWTTAN